MRKYLIAAASGLGLLTVGIPAAQAGTGGEPPPAGVVSAKPVTNTPHLLTTTSTTEQIRQLVPCGGTMYAVGTFTSIRKGSTTYARTDIFSFSASAPYTVTSWAPNVVGSTSTGETGTDAINSIAFVNGNCSVAYIGGHFTSVNGTSVSDIAAISTSTGDVIGSFAHSANGGVDTLASVNGHLLVGGGFTSVNGSGIPYMVSLSPSTGKSDGFLNLSITGSKVYNQQISHGGTLDLVEGVFSSAGGVTRHQMFMLNVGGTKAAVTGWYSPDFNVSCVLSFWARGAAWSPDDSTIYVATTGYHVSGSSTHGTQNGPCDVALAYPATKTSVSHTWINYTGCDSLYSVAADSKAAYFGGHERYSMNQDACNTEGPGAYPAPGLEGVDPANGHLYIDSAGTAGYYSRARGLGADDMLATSAGLWIASDNANGSASCGGVTGLAGICFLPYSPTGGGGGPVIATTSLPVANRADYAGADKADAYRKTMSATGGTTPYAWSATGLPAGLSLSSGGSLTGTGTAKSGKYTVSFTVTDAAGLTGTAALTLTLRNPSEIHANYKCGVFSNRHWRIFNTEAGHRGRYVNIYAWNGTTKTWHWREKLWVGWLKSPVTKVANTSKIDVRYHDGYGHLRHALAKAGTFRAC